MNIEENEHICIQVSEISSEANMVALNMILLQRNSVSVHIIPPSIEIHLFLPVSNFSVIYSRTTSLLSCHMSGV